MAAPRALSATAAFAAGVATGRLVGSDQLRFARMAGSSIAAPDAAGWVTDFLNAAYFRRPDREVDDLRLAFCILTTRWHRLGRRLRAADVLAFHRAFGSARLRGRPGSPRGALSRMQLLDGAVRLLGPWFPAAYGDERHRGWGIAFESLHACREYRPEARLARARVGTLTPESAPPERQTWHTYPAVALSSVRATIGALAHPERWTDYATEVGRFTALRSGGLAGQTFEIEVAAGTAGGHPVFTRGYVTVTRVVTHDEDAEGLHRYVAELNDGLRRYGRDEPPAVPGDADPVLACDLTTHEGHFMGSGHNRLVIYESPSGAYVRAAGTWDPLPWHLAGVYALAGREAQHAFWGQGDPALSMLHQLPTAVR
jgi:hypothetical protein